jgi:hypothetical protein
MNNTDEKLLLYCRCLETITFSLHKDVENVDYCAAVFRRERNKELTVPRVLLWPTFFTPTEILPVACEAVD